MEEFINSAGVQIVLAIITIIEFIVAIVSYKKISKVRQSQVEYRDIIELDNILNNLHDNTILLSTIKSDSHVDLPIEISERLDKIVAHNYECIGAVNKANQILLNNEKISHDNEVIYHDRGYFNTDFYTNNILNAKKRVIFNIKRNIRPFTLDNLSALIKLADDKNVNITLFAFSPQMDRKILNEMMKSIPNCPESVEDLCNTQTVARNMYLDQKRQMRNPQNIIYYEYYSYPLSQYIIVDNTFYWGIVNYNKTNMNNAFEERPYIEMDVTNPFAQFIISLQETLISECTSNGSVY